MTTLLRIRVDEDKVGKDLSEAIFTNNNNALKFYDVPKTGLKVDRGMTHDGLGKYLSAMIKKLLALHQILLIFSRKEKLT